MGWFDGWKAATGYSDKGTSTIGIASPWSSSSHLAAAILPALPDGPITVGKALAVPPVSRAIQLYSTAIAGFPLTTPEAETPTELVRTEGAVTPGLRAALTFQDLFFHGGSLWSNEPDSRFQRVPFEDWTVDQDGNVLDNDANVKDPSSYIFIASLLPMGFLDFAKSSVNHYHGVMRAILDRSENPIPITELKVTGPADPDEVKAAQEAYSAARRNKGGSVTITPELVDLIVHEAGNDANLMMTEARNACRLDFANFANINAAMLDGNNGTSDTYSNTLQNQNEFLTLSMRTFLTPIEQRLSQADAVGSPVRFDTSAFDTATTAAGNTGTATPGTETA